MDFAVGAFFGFVVAIMWRRLTLSSLSFRPGMEWVPEANCDSDYKRAAYLAAGKTLEVRVKFAQPVPCPGISMCSGMTGIWLHREDVKKLKPYQFTDQMWKEYSKITT